MTEFQTGAKRVALCFKVFLLRCESSAVPALPGYKTSEILWAISSVVIGDNCSCNCISSILNGKKKKKKHWGRVACKRRSHYHRLHDKWRRPRDARSISFLMIGKSWFPDWNEYGKDLYPAAESRSPLISSCPPPPRFAYQQLFFFFFTRCIWYLPAPALFCPASTVECDTRRIIYHHISSFFKV